MPRISYRNESDYLAVDIAGSWTLKALEQVSEAIVARAKENGYTRVLVDVTAMSGLGASVEWFELGKHVALVARHMRVAVIELPERIDRFFESVAVNRGASVCVFADSRSAARWLVAAR